MSCSITLDSSLKKLYSFNLLNHEHKKHGGFSIESLKRYLDDYEDSLMAVFTIFLDKFTFDALKKNIKWFIEHTKETSYSFLNIIAYGLHLPIQFTNRMVCSQFVDNILKRVGVDVTGKRSSQVSAATFYKSNSEYIYKCYEGEIKKYKPSTLNKNINKIKDKKVLLVDDIYTTGSTVNEIANNLIKSGVKDVGIITIAKD